MGEALCDAIGVKLGVCGSSFDVAGIDIGDNGEFVPSVGETRSGLRLGASLSREFQHFGCGAPLVCCALLLHVSEGDVVGKSASNCKFDSLGTAEETTGVSDGGCWSLGSLG